jgi:hypothetical protein
MKDVNTLLDEYFTQNFSYNLGQLSRYNEYDGKRFWTAGFESLSDSLSSLKLIHEKDHEHYFINLEFVLNKIQLLGPQPQVSTNKELEIFIDYFKLKAIQLVYEIEKNKE